MNKFWLPVVLAAAALSAPAFAEHHRDGYGDDNYPHRHHHRIERVVVHHVYDEPQVVYEAPQVVYRERVVYRDRPVYYEQAPRYQERSAAYSDTGSNRIVGQTIGAVAGGLIGNGVGKGNGRVAATAVGAVLGTLVGGNMATSGRWE